MTSTDFGQEVRLTARLHDLVRSYPRGSSIINEFIQNADDAESTSLTVTLDKSSYTGERLEDQRMVSLLGPALLVHNESIFSDPDFESIQRIGESSKAESGPKTGRFGVGFNTCYNITDFPSFVSGHFLVCFDPHYSAVAERHKAPGKRWRLSDAWAGSPDWLRSFCAAGLKDNASYFPGTIFRFPLRTPEQASVSKIWKEPFCLDDYSRIIQQLSEDGPQLLLFTKYLTELTAFIADGTKKQLLHISTSNPREVVRARDPLLRSVQVDLNKAINKWKTLRGNLPVCSYEHSFRVSAEKAERIETWRVVNGLFAGPTECLLDAAEKMISIGEKALPLAGAAVRIEPNQPNNVTPKGKVYCGLPLPVDSEVTVHLNGYFDLDSSRHALSTGDNVFGQNQYRVAWNKALMQHGVSAAYARLLMDVRTQFQESNAEQFYKLFPPAAQDSSLFSVLSLGLYSKVAQQPVIQTVSQGTKAWRALNAAYDCPMSIREPLVADGKPVIEPPLPFFIVQGFAKNGIVSKSFTPRGLAGDLRVTKDVNCVLSATPRKCLSRREWVTSLLKFCLEDKGCQLKGLPLAFAQDGKLHTFGFTRGGLLFHGSAIHKQIFSTDHDWFVDEQFQKEAGVPYQPLSGFRQMTTSDVIARGAEKLRSVNGADRISKDGFPSEHWLTAVFKCLSSASSGREAP